MKTKKADYGYIRDAFMVRRYHTVGYIHRSESVGHHTANVIGIIFHLYDDNPPIHMVRYALHHDAPEMDTGDLPATAKWGFPDVAFAISEAEDSLKVKFGLETQKLEGIELALMKYADMMDLCFKCVEELASGNMTVSNILDNGMGVVTSLLKGQLKGHVAAEKLMNLLMSNPHVMIGTIENERPAQALN